MFYCISFRLTTDYTIYLQLIAAFDLMIVRSEWALDLQPQHLQMTNFRSNICEFTHR
jgi:hypothetical protein